MLLLLAGSVTARERHLHHLHLPLLRGEYVISNLSSSLFFLIHGAFLQPTPHAHLLPPFIYIYIYIYISRQSKHKEDTTATHPILLNELELEVYSSLSHAFSLPCVTMCSPSFFIIIHHFFFLHAYLSLLNIRLLSFSFFFLLCF